MFQLCRVTIFIIVRCNIIGRYSFCISSWCWLRVRMTMQSIKCLVFMTGVDQLTKAGTKFRVNYARTVDSVAFLMMDSYNPRSCDEAVLSTNEVASRDKVASVWHPPPPLQLAMQCPQRCKTSCNVSNNGNCTIMSSLTPCMATVQLNSGFEQIHLTFSKRIHVRSSVSVVKSID